MKDEKKQALNSIILWTATSPKGVRSLHVLQPASLKVMNDLLVKTDDSIIILLPMLLMELIMQF